MSSDNFHALDEFLGLIDAPISAAEIHGLMTGTLCAGGGRSQHDRQKNYAAWLDTVGLRVPVQVVGPHLVAEFVWVEEPSSGDVVVIVASRPDDELVWISVASWP